MANVTWNPDDKANGLELTDGNTTATVKQVNGYIGVRGTVSHSTGLRYFEATVTLGNEGSTGIATASASINDPLGYGSDQGLGLYGDGTLYAGGSGYDSTEGQVGGIRMGFLVDIDARRLWIRASNGNWSHGGNPASGGAGIDFSHITAPVFPMFTGYYGDDTSTIYSDPDTIIQGLPSGASLWGDSGTVIPARKAIRSLQWF